MCSRSIVFSDRPCGAGRPSAAVALGGAVVFASGVSKIAVQLFQVARPGVRHRLGRAPIEAADRLALAVAGHPYLGGHQRRTVVDAVAQRRDGQGDPADAIEEILPEAVRDDEGAEAVRARPRSAARSAVRSRRPEQLTRRETSFLFESGQRPTPTCRLQTSTKSKWWPQRDSMAFVSPKSAESFGQHRNGCFLRRASCRPFQTAPST